MPSGPVVPAGLAVAPEQKLLLSADARGVQIYECLADKSDATHFAWSFLAPDAELFDDKGHVIGKHYAGPTWESRDGSKVVGVVVARENGPDANAIPWLLLNAKSTSGTGPFGITKSIQRIGTWGGKAPADGCDASRAGTTLRVPYTATYRFYGGASQ